MAAKLTKSDGTDAYTLENFPSVPGDRIDLSIPLNFDTYAIQHKRNNVIVSYGIIETKYIWNLLFKNVSQSMIENLRDLMAEDQLRLYPDSANPLYYDVYWLSKFKTKYVRGGTYNLSVILLQR